MMFLKRFYSKQNRKYNDNNLSYELIQLKVLQKVITSENIC